MMTSKVEEKKLLYYKMLGNYFLNYNCFEQKGTQKSSEVDAYQPISQTASVELLQVWHTPSSQVPHGRIIYNLQQSTTRCRTHNGEAE